jgi:hypothetical protein
MYTDYIMHINNEFGRFIGNKWLEYMLYIFCYLKEPPGDQDAPYLQNKTEIR